MNHILLFSSPFGTTFYTWHDNIIIRVKLPVQHSTCSHRCLTYIITDMYLRSLQPLYRGTCLNPLTVFSKFTISKALLSRPFPELSWHFRQNTPAPDSSLADLYDPLTMPPALKKAHEANDRAVEKAYGRKFADEAEIVAYLMQEYQRLIGEKK